jgi:hypothetical protein
MIVMRRGFQKEGSVESWGLAVELEAIVLKSLLAPSTLDGTKQALARHRISGYSETVSRNVESKFVGTVVAGFYGGDKNTLGTHGYFELQPVCYQDTLSRLALAGTYDGHLITYDDFVDNPTMVANASNVSHSHRMMVGVAMRDVASLLQADQDRGWGVLREAGVEA